MKTKSTMDSYRLEYNPDQEGCWHIEPGDFLDNYQSRPGWHLIVEGYSDIDALQAFTEYIDSHQVFEDQEMPSPSELTDRFHEFYAGWVAARQRFDPYPRVDPTAYPSLRFDSTGRAWISTPWYDEDSIGWD